MILLDLSSLANGDIFKNIYTHLSDPQTLKLKQVCNRFLQRINQDTPFQTRIAHRYLLDHQHSAGIPLDSIQYFLQQDRLVVDIKDGMSIIGATEKLTPSFPWITHLIVRKGFTHQLQDLFKIVQGSTRLQAVFLFECELGQTCLSDLNGKINLYFCKTIATFDLSFLEKQPMEISDEPNEIEKILGEDTEIDLLPKFREKVKNPETSSEEVLQIFDAMKSSQQAKVISGIWYAAIMDPNETVRRPVQEINRLSREYIAKNPHHPAILSAL